MSTIPTAHAILRAREAYVSGFQAAWRQRLAADAETIRQLCQEVETLRGWLVVAIVVEICTIIVAASIIWR